MNEQEQSKVMAFDYIFSSWQNNEWGFDKFLLRVIGAIHYYEDKSKEPKQ